MGSWKVQERASERIEKVPGQYVDGTLNISQVAERGKQSDWKWCSCECVCMCVLACMCVFACVRCCVCVCVSVCGTSLYWPKQSGPVSLLKLSLLVVTSWIILILLSSLGMATEALITDVFFFWCYSIMASIWSTNSMLQYNGLYLSDLPTLSQQQLCAW